MIDREKRIEGVEEWRRKWDIYLWETNRWMDLNVCDWMLDEYTNEDDKTG